MPWAVSFRRHDFGSGDDARGLAPGVFVRDPFGTCPARTAAAFTWRLRPEHHPGGPAGPQRHQAAESVPTPTNGSHLFQLRHFAALFEHRNSFDTRMDINFNEKNQFFYRFSLVDDPQFIPGIFGGVADGGGFQQGTQTANAQQSALG